MTKYLAGVLSVIAAGVLLIAYGLLAPQASATFSGNDRFGVTQVMPQGYGAPANGYAGTYQTGLPAGAALYATPYAVPVNMAVQAVQQPLVRPAAYDLAPAPQVTAAAPAPRHVTGAVKRTPRRDWKKTAMVVGGSSATGAGVGAIFGGKKGALIGAAIGGGASALWETTKQ